MAEDLSRRHFLGAAAAAAAAIDMPGLEVRRLLGGTSGLQPSPRSSRLGYASGGGDKVVPPEGWDLADGYGEELQSSTYLSDLIHLGLPNGDFTYSDDDDDTSDFWTMVNGTGSWSVVVDSTAPGGYVIRYTTTAGAGAVAATLESARVPVTDVFGHAIAVYYDSVWGGAGSVTMQLEADWYDEAGNIVDTTADPLPVTINLNLSKQRGEFTRISANTSGTNAAEVAFRILMTHTAGAGTTVSIRTIAKGTTKPASLVLESTTDITTTGDVSAARVSSSEALVAAGQLYATGIVTSSPGSNQNNWNPGSGWTNGNAAVIRADPSAAIDVTGLTGGASGRMAILLNVSTNAILLKHESASSTAANRFTLPGGADYSVGGRRFTMLWYDTTNSRWYILDTA